MFDAGLFKMSCTLSTFTMPKPKMAMKAAKSVARAKKSAMKNVMKKAKTVAAFPGAVRLRRPKTFNVPKAISYKVAFLKLNRKYLEHTFEASAPKQNGQAIGH